MQYLHITITTHNSDVGMWCHFCLWMSHDACIIDVSLGVMRSYPVYSFIFAYSYTYSYLYRTWHIHVHTPYTNMNECVSCGVMRWSPAYSFIISAYSHTYSYDKCTQHTAATTPRILTPRVMYAKEPHGIAVCCSMFQGVAVCCSVFGLTARSNTTPTPWHHTRPFISVYICKSLHTRVNTHTDPYISTVYFPL